jgi:hypothetical protein
MGYRSRLLALLALVVLLFALPGTGFAGNPVQGTRPALPGPKVQVATPAAVTLPTFIPGAQVKSIGFGTMPFGPGSATVIVGNPDVTNHIWDFYDSNAGGELDVPLGLPAGAKLWQVDVYGYTTGSVAQAWTLWDEHPADGDVYDIAATATTSAGPALVQGTMSFPSGLTLAAGHDWIAGIAVTNVDSAVVGLIVQYTMPTLSLAPITPIRVFDSRISRFGGPVVKNSPRTVNTKDAINPVTGVVTLSNAIPVGAKAVSYNLTVTNTVGTGNIDVLPGGSTTITGSSINWTGTGQTIANGGIVTLGTGAHERQITLVLSGTSANAIVDITGYYW